MHLVINSYGATLQKENDLFVITTPEGRQSLPPDKVKTITIAKAARITSDAVILAIRHQVDILFVNEQGMPEGRVWSVRYGSISNIRRAQLDFLYSERALFWVKALLVEKINNQVGLLLAVQPPPEVLPGHNLVRHAINSLEDYKRKIERCEGDSVSDAGPSLRGWEGAASKKYFAVISALLPTAYQFESRSRLPAKDPFNAFLNYAYGILYGKVEGALIKAGADPYVGVFHRDEYNRPALVFDLIEKFRVWMDYVVFMLFSQHALTVDCFTQSDEMGGVRIEALGKRILIQAVNDYLSEIISRDGKERSRAVHIDMEATKLAQYFMDNT
jgi:CRISPR-associated protein Cas1